MKDCQFAHAPPITLRTLRLSFGVPFACRSEHPPPVILSEAKNLKTLEGQDPSVAMLSQDDSSRGNIMPRWKAGSPMGCLSERPSPVTLRVLRLSL